MLATPTKPYIARKWTLSGLRGISDASLQTHFGLYEGYVKNINLLNERLAEIRAKDRFAGSDPAYAELIRRVAFEYNGMRLHELYFDNMTSKPSTIGSGSIYSALGNAFGGFERWKADFIAVSSLRGVGWAIAYYDTASHQIANHWIGDHEIGHPVGCVPIVVLDVWEHAFLADYKPSERGKYIEAFLANVDWGACEARLPLSEARR